MEEMECRSVLIVDDDQDIRNTLSEALESVGYQVHTAINGKDALDVLKRFPKDQLPGCILLDLSMPVMNGPDFLKSIETEYRDEFGEIPIIVASANLAHFDDKSLVKSVQQLRKPMDLADLYKAIEHHCGRPAA